MLSRWWGKKKPTLIKIINNVAQDLQEAGYLSVLWGMFTRRRKMELAGAFKMCILRSSGTYAFVCVFSEDIFKHQSISNLNCVFKLRKVWDFL